MWFFNDMAHIWHIYSKYFAFRRVSAQLQDIINTLASSRPTVTSTTQHAPTKTETTSLTIPQQLESYDQDDYPDVPFWHEADWTSYSDKQRDGGNNIAKLHFLTEEDGDQVSERRIKEMMEHAKQAWTQLYYHRLDPSSWKKKSEDAMRYFNTIMKTKFPEFRYCDGDWKVEKFATIKYPDWNRNTREKGVLSRKSYLIHLQFLILFQEHGHPSARQMIHLCLCMIVARKRSKASLLKSLTL
jgi:hypothetical protein